MQRHSHTLKAFPAFVAVLAVLFATAGLRADGNNPPVLSVTGPGVSGAFPDWETTVIEDTGMVAVTVTASDPDIGDQLTLSADVFGSYTGVAPAVSASPVSGESPVSLTVSGVPDVPGVIIYELILNDGNGWMAMGRLTVTVKERNLPPEIDVSNNPAIGGTFPDLTATGVAGEALGGISLAIVDPNPSDSMSISVVRTGGDYAGDELNVVITPALGDTPAFIQIAGTPTDGGTLVYTITVSDGQDTTTANLTLTVTELNVAPSLTVAGVSVAGSDGFWTADGNALSTLDTITITATDGNPNDSLELTVTRVGGTGDGLVIDTSSAFGVSPAKVTISGEPTSAGTAMYDISVTDGNGGSASGVLVVIIDDAVVSNAVPVLHVSGNAVSGTAPDWSATACAGDPVGVIAVSGSDSDADDTLTLTVVRSGGTYTGSALQIDASPAAGQSPVGLTVSGVPTSGGTIVYTITLSDDAGATVTGTLTLVVSDMPEINSAPAITVTGTDIDGRYPDWTATAWWGESIAPITITATDPDGDMLIVSVTREGVWYGDDPLNVYPAGTVAGVGNASLTMYGDTTQVDSVRYTILATDSAGNVTTATLTVVSDYDDIYLNAYYGYPSDCATECSIRSAPARAASSSVPAILAAVLLAFGLYRKHRAG